MIRKIFLSAVFSVACNLLMAQQITEISINQCYGMATATSPLYQQKALTIAAGNLARKNLNLKWLPQLDVNAQATYQSDVTAIPIKLPNINIPTLDKDQYKGTMDLVQPVFDGGVISREKKLQQFTTAADAQKVEIDLYQLKSTVTSYFFTALLMDENIGLMNLEEQDLDNSLKTVSAQVTNGIATGSNADLIKAELLKVAQQKTEFESGKKQALQMLSILTGAGIGQQTRLIRPLTTEGSADTVVLRPELKLFDLQQKGIQLQSRLITARTNPKLSIFADGGYGKPGLNQLKNDFQWFYISGVKLTVPIMSHLTQQRDRDVLKIQERIVTTQKENFMLNNRQLLVRQQDEIEKYRELMRTDSAIISLRTGIKKNAFVKLTNGIITTDDYVRELNAENEAMLNQKLHEVALLQAQYNYKIILGE